MKTALVNGHVLPSNLAQMVAEGLWGPSCKTADFSALPIEDKDDLTLLNIDGMIGNTKDLYDAMERDGGRLFSLTRGGAPISGFLDVNQAVVIAVTYGQEVLALDYSSGETPRVVATYYQPGTIKWVEVARSFDELLDILKLSMI